MMKDAPQVFFLDLRASVLGEEFHITYGNGTQSPYAAGAGVTLWSYLGGLVAHMRRGDAAGECAIGYHNSSGYLGQIGFDHEGSAKIAPSNTTNIVLKLARNGNYGCGIEFYNSHGLLGTLEAKDDGHLYWSGTMIV